MNNRNNDGISSKYYSFSAVPETIFLSLFSVKPIFVFFRVLSNVFPFSISNVWFMVCGDNHQRFSNRTDGGLEQMKILLHDFHLKLRIKQGLCVWCIHCILYNDWIIWIGVHCITFIYRDQIGKDNYYCLINVPMYHCANTGTRWRAINYYCDYIIWSGNHGLRALYNILFAALLHYMLKRK